MREVQKRQLQFGQVPVDKVWLDPKSRDDIPAVLKGLQHLYKEKQEELFMLLEKHILPGTHRMANLRRLARLVLAAYQE